MKLERNQFDDGIPTTVLISVLYPLGPAAIILSPMIVGGVVDGYGFSEQQAGLIASLEGMGLVIASIVASLWVRKFSWLKVLLYGLLVTAGLNLVSANLNEFTPLVVTRFIAGFMGGSVFAVVVVALGDNRQPDRAFGIAQVIQGAMMFAAFAAAPVLIQAMGVKGIFYLLAAASLLMMLTLLRFPDHGVDHTKLARSTAIAEGNTILIWFGLFASFAFFINIFGFWAFIERIGQAAQLSPGSIGLALGISQIAAIGGAMAAALASDRFGRIKPLLIVFVGQCWALWALVGQFGVVTFFIGAGLFQALFMLGVSFQMGAIAKIDIKGKFLVLMTAAQGLGAAFGPSLAAALIREGDDYSGINLMAAISCLISTLLFFVIIRRSHQAAAG